MDKKHCNMLICNKKKKKKKESRIIYFHGIFITLAVFLKFLDTRYPKMSFKHTLNF